MNIRKLVIASIAAVFFLLTVLPAHATLITQIFPGKITFADPTNPFDVNVGHSFLWETTYDNSLVSLSGPSTIYVGSNPNYKLMVPVGKVGTKGFKEFVETQDVEYYDVNYYLPGLIFSDGKLVGINFTVGDPNEPGTVFTHNGRQNLAFTTNLPPFQSTFNSFSIFDTTNYTPMGDPKDCPVLVSGNLDFTPIPEPASLFLLSSGLLGLAVVRKRLRRP